MSIEPGISDDGQQFEGRHVCDVCPDSLYGPIPQPEHALRRILTGFLANRIVPGGYWWDDAANDLNLATLTAPVVLGLPPGAALRTTLRSVRGAIQAGLERNALAPLGGHSDPIVRAIALAAFDTATWLQIPEVWQRVERLAEALIDEEPTLTHQRIHELAGYQTEELRHPEYAAPPEP
jgi:hypothetical protein